MEGDWNVAEQFWKLPARCLRGGAHGDGFSTPSERSNLRLGILPKKGPGYGMETNFDAKENNVLEVLNDAIKNSGRRHSVKRTTCPVLVRSHYFPNGGHEEPSCTKYVPKQLNGGLGQSLISPIIMRLTFRRDWRLRRKERKERHQ